MLDRGEIVYDGDVETAIAIYEQRGAGHLQKEISLEPLPRGEVTLGIKHKMTRFTFETGPELAMGAPLAFTLSVESRAAEENMCLRGMVYGPDGAPVGMATTKIGRLSAQPGAWMLRGQVDVSALAPGDYSLKLALYAVNEFGAEERWDVVDGVVFFRVAPGDGVNAMAWSRRWWGNIRLPEILVR